MNFDFILEDERVRIEPLKEKHIDDLLPIALAYPDLIQYSPSEFGTKSALKSYIDSAISQRDEGQRYPFAIFDKSKGKYAGSTSFGNVSLKDHRCVVGWTWIGKEHQGTGLNKACKVLFLNHLFNELGFLRIEFHIDARNAQSRRAVEKLGAIFEGELRSHTVMVDGFRRNTCIYSILIDEWKNVNASFID